MRALVAALVVLLALPAAASADTAPWQSAGRVTDGLFDAQTELVLTGPRARVGRRGAGAAGLRR